LLAHGRTLVVAPPRLIGSPFGGGRTMSEDGAVSGSAVRPRSRDAHPESRTQRLLVVLGIVVLAFNLRPAAVSVGPVLVEATRELAMSPTTAGVLTTLPVVAFAGFGALAPWLARRIGLHRSTLVALVAVVVGLAVRARLSDVPAFLALSLLALAGMATANVLLPSLVKLHFPDRIGLMTSVYTTALAIGLTSASVLTVPVSDHLGSWRWGLLGWAGTAAVAAVPWVLLARRDRSLEAQPRGISLGAVARTRLGWSLALFFGLQSLQAYSVFGWIAQVYRDAGFSAAEAGLLLGLVTAVGIPLSLWLPTWAAGMRTQTRLLVGLSLCAPVGYVGLLVAPVAGAWLWALLIGTATSVFPVVLVLVGLRARTSDGTAALSGFTQSVGYLIAAVGPFGMGALYETTGGWTVPLLALSLLIVPQIVFGVVISRPAAIEDQVRSPQ
jgi:CP family cyanate transporter-like MFS transporter